MSGDPTDPPDEGQKTRRFIPLLRLVHPITIEPPPKRRKGVRGPLVFSAEEQQCLLASLRTARNIFGTWRALAAAMHVNPARLAKGTHGKGRPVTPELAVRLAKALNVPLERLTQPGIREVKKPCPTCGGDGAA